MAAVDVEGYGAGGMEGGEGRECEGDGAGCDTWARSLQRGAGRGRERVEAAGGGGAGRADEIPRVLRPERKRTFVVVSAAIAAAAAVVALVFLPGPPPAGELPVYTLEASGGARAVRSTEPAPEGLPRFRAGDRMQLDLRPDEGSPDAPQVRIFLDRIDGASVVDGVAWQIAESGAARGVATVGEALQLAPGEHRLILALASGDTPFDPDRIEACHAGGEGPWQTFIYRFEVVEP